MGTVKSAQREKFEREAFPHLEALWRTALGLTLRDKSAENLVVKTMVRAYRTWDKSTDTVGSAARLFRFLTREFSRIGQRKHRPGRFLHENNRTVEDSGNGGRQPISASIDQSEVLLLTGIPDISVRGTVARLRPQSRLMTLLLMREGFSYAEIAYITDPPKDPVKSTLTRLRKLIPRYLVQQAHPSAAATDNPATVPDMRTSSRQDQPEG